MSRPPDDGGLGHAGFGDYCPVRPCTSRQTHSGRARLWTLNWQFFRRFGTPASLSSGVSGKSLPNGRFSLAWALQSRQDVPSSDAGRLAAVVDQRPDGGADDAATDYGEFLASRPRCRRRMSPWPCGGGGGGCAEGYEVPSTDRTVDGGRADGRSERADAGQEHRGQGPRLGQEEAAGQEKTAGKEKAAVEEASAGEEAPARQEGTRTPEGTGTTARGIEAARTRAPGSGLRCAREARANPRAELWAREGLGQIVGRAGVEASARAALVGLRREHEDREGDRRRIGAEGSQHVQAVELGHDEIEDHEVWRLPAHHLEGLASVRGFGEDVAVVLKRPRREATHDRVVVHDQDARPGSDRGGRWGRGLGPAGGRDAARLHARAAALERTEHLDRRASALGNGARAPL